MVNSLLYFGLVTLVESAGRFVENQDARLLDKGTGQGNSLLLAARELSTAGADVLVDFIRVLAHEVPGVSFPESLLDLSVRCVRLAHKDVLLDRGIEEDWLLADVTDLLAVVAEVDVFQVHSVDEDLAGAGVVETLNELHSGGLT